VSLFSDPFPQLSPETLLPSNGRIFSGGSGASAELRSAGSGVEFAAGSTGEPKVLSLTHPVSNRSSEPIHMNVFDTEVVTPVLGFDRVNRQ
jgi:hypothetical protein